MAMFQYGSKHYSDRVRNLISGNDLQHFFKMYKMKYWGLVDSETWQENEKSALSGEGEIKAKYVAESGTEVFLVRTTDQDRNLLYFLVQADVDDSFVETHQERMREEVRQYEEEMTRMREQGNRRNGYTISSTTSPRRRNSQPVAEQPVAEQEVSSYRNRNGEIISNFFAEYAATRPISRREDDLF